MFDPFLGAVMRGDTNITVQERFHPFATSFCEKRAQ